MILKLISHTSKKDFLNARLQDHWSCELRVTFLFLTELGMVISEFRWAELDNELHPDFYLAELIHLENCTIVTSRNIWEYNHIVQQIVAFQVSSSQLIAARREHFSFKFCVLFINFL